MPMMHTVGATAKTAWVNPCNWKVGEVVWRQAGK